MTTKTWARLAGDGATVAELHAFDAALMPGRDIPGAWSQDVTNVSGIAVGWVLGSDGMWTAPSAVVLSQAQLVAHAGAKQASLLGVGITVNIGSVAVPVEAVVATDAAGIGRVTTNVQMIGLAATLNKPAPAFSWDNGGGVTLALNVSQMQAISWAMNVYLQATQTTLSQILTAIADGAITTTAAIDTPVSPIAWPATSY